MELLNMITADIPGTVYPLSVVEGTQSGDIFECGDSVIIWHKCGFAVVVGCCGKSQLDRVYSLMTNGGRRLVLFSRDEAAREYFTEKADIVAERRYFYEYGAYESPQLALPSGFSISEISSGNIGGIKGRITPAFSWDCDEEFLARGKGFCVLHENKPVAWALSAAVSSKELDIGVETVEEYRGRGFAAAAASRLTRYALLAGKKPVWACHSENIASQRTAEKLGFVKASECTTFRKS